MKSIYLAKRNPDLTHEQFIRRWRKHGALAMCSAFWHQMAVYVQAELIESRVKLGVAGDYDGVTTLMARGASAFRDPTAEEAQDIQLMLRDEYETFVGPAADYLLPVTESVLKAGPRGGFTAYLFFVDPARAAGVARHYQSSEVAQRVVLNSPQPDQKQDGIGSRIPYTTVVEVSARDMDVLHHILGLQDSAPWRSADLPMLTRECVMWDATLYP
jgi:hypothetical protein